MGGKKICSAGTLYTVSTFVYVVIYCLLINKHCTFCAVCTGSSSTTQRPFYHTFDNMPITTNFANTFSPPIYHVIENATTNRKRRAPRREKWEERRGWAMAHPQKSYVSFFSCCNNVTRRRQPLPVVLNTIFDATRRRKPLPVTLNTIFNAMRRGQPLPVVLNTIFNVMRRVSTLPATPNPLLTTTMQ